MPPQWYACFCCSEHSDGPLAVQMGCVIHAFCLQVLPVSLSATAYHLFQLTECSTVFLHLSWMAAKSQAQYDTLFKVSIALLVTFVVRCFINAGIVWHVSSRLMELQLWNVCLHPTLKALVYYCFGTHPFCDFTVERTVTKQHMSCASAVRIMHIH